MSVVIAENFSDFSLVKDEVVMSNATNADKIATLIPSDVFPFTIDSRPLSGSISWRSTTDSGAAIDKHHPDDCWLAFIRGSWQSTASFRTYVKVPSVGVYTKDGTWFLSMKVCAGTYTGAAAENIFGVWMGDGITPVMRITGSGEAYVGTTKVNASLLAPSTAQAPMGLDLIIVSSGTKASIKVYVNNVLIGSTDTTYAANAESMCFGWNVTSSVSTKPDTIMSMVRDVVVSYDDGAGYSGRCGKNFYVQKMLPSTDVESQWIGDAPHSTMMARPYPSASGEAFLSAYMFGQKEVFRMQPIDSGRGSIVADMSIEVDARNTGTTTVPFEYTFNGITAGVKSAAGSSAVQRMLPMPLNPETGREWAISDLSDYTAGFGIEERK